MIDIQHNRGILMIPEKLTEVLKHDGVVAIATLGQDGPHMVNTWNSYVRITDAERILIPVGYMHRTSIDRSWYLARAFRLTRPSFQVQ